MKVYVLEVDCYEWEHVHGVYATLDAAKEAHSPVPPAGTHHSYLWGEYDGCGWRFGADWSDAARITEWEVSS